MRRYFLSFLCTAIACTYTLTAEDQVAGSLPAQPQEAPAAETIKTSKTIFSNLSSAEKAFMGLDKLTDEQMSRLETWLKTAKCKKLLEKPAYTTVEVAITEIKDNGRYVTLANGMQIEISGAARKKSAAWKVDDLLRVEETSRKNWVRIVHFSSNQHARAKIVSGQIQQPQTDSPENTQKTKPETSQTSS